MTRRELIAGLAGGVPIFGQAIKYSKLGGIYGVPTFGLVGDWNPALSLAGLSVGDPVDTLVDGSGQGRNATGSSTARPTYQVAAAGFPVLRFDGSNDLMTTGSFSLSQPFTICVCISPSLYSSGPRFVDGNTVNQAVLNTGTLISSNGVSDVNLTAYDGTAFVPLVAVPDLGQFRSIIVKHNGSSSSMQISDGVPVVANPGSGGISTGLRFGAAGNGTQFASFDFARALLFNYALSSEDMWRVNRYFSVMYGTKSRRRYVLCEGDSLTYGTSTSNPPVTGWPNQTSIALGSDWGIFRNNGVAGKTLATMLTDATAIDKYASAFINPIFVLWGGTNDLMASTATATIITNYSGMCSARRSAGFKVVAVTILPRSAVGTPVGFEVDRQTVNLSIRTNYATYADYLVDLGNDATIGQAGQELNATYYNADKVHLNDTGVAYAIANYWQPAMQATQ